MNDPFWLTVPIEAMTEAQWESLCDGCGLCCQIRVEDEDSGEIALSNAACRFLDLECLRCSDYEHRFANVPDCIKVSPANIRSLHWLPSTCGYRRAAFGHDLPEWHHLRCGDRERVHLDGPSMRGELISEDDADLEY